MLEFGSGRRKRNAHQEICDAKIPEDPVMWMGFISMNIEPYSD
jgi:hypothetical protein